MLEFSQNKVQMQISSSYQGFSDAQTAADREIVDIKWWSVTAKRCTDDKPFGGLWGRR